MNGAIRLAPYLTSECADRLDAQCSGRWCRQAVKPHPATGRWFITDGHPGALSAINLRAGYRARASAVRAMRAGALAELGAEQAVASPENKCRNEQKELAFYCYVA